MPSSSEPCNLGTCPVWKTGPWEPVSYKATTLSTYKFFFIFLIVSEDCLVLICFKMLNGGWWRGFEYLSYVFVWVHLSPLFNIDTQNSLFISIIINGCACLGNFIFERSLRYFQNIDWKHLKVVWTKPNWVDKGKHKFVWDVNRMKCNEAVVKFRHHVKI